ncbi:hypothetical protein PQX77_009428 [Marasmius sp. AFHP31]|nr:hypothetical protein PQX77_009428 [Marasmius sp. AFHP31]
MATSTTGIPWVNETIELLNKNHVTLLELLREILRNGRQINHMRPHRDNILLNIESVLDLLLEQAESAVSAEIASAAEKIYRVEVQELVKRESGLQMNAVTATLEQMESFSIPDLAVKMTAVCPKLWDLVTGLLDANGSKRRR